MNSLVCYLQVLIEMKSGLLSTSGYGSFHSREEGKARLVQLGQGSQLTHCRVTLDRERVYLMDSKGSLSCLRLLDQSISTLPHTNIQHYLPDSWSSLSLTAVSPSSELLHIHFENKKVCKVFSPHLNTLTSFDKNYLTETVLLSDTKSLVLVDSRKQIRSVKAQGNSLFLAACFLGSNRVGLLSRGGQLRVFQSTSLKLVSALSLSLQQWPETKMASSSCGKTVAVYGKSKWLVLLLLGQEGTFLEKKLAEMPFESIIQLQFSYSEQVLILGSDRVLYGLQYEGEVGSLRPIFNEDQRQIPTGFDISPDEKLVVLTAGKVVLLLELEKGLARAINRAAGISVDFSEEKIDQENQRSPQQQKGRNRRDIRYEEEELRPAGKLPSQDEDSLRDEQPLLESVLRNQGRRQEAVQRESGSNLQGLLQKQQRLRAELTAVRTKGNPVRSHN